VEKCVLGAVSKFVPTKTLRGRNHLRWMNSTILHYIKKKNSIRTRIKRSCHPSEHLKHRFRELRRTIKRMLRESRLDYINSICASREPNPKRFWSFFKIKSKVSNIPLNLVKIKERIPTTT
jgi:thiamine kinase-like enzyme